MGLMAAALVVVMASGAGAEVVTEQSASILVFPKVIANGTRDTLIQITNTSNSMVRAHCFYVNAALDCTEVDFDITLTKQQPTYWVVSEGRLVDPMDRPCTRVPPYYECTNAGIDPGRVPPVVEDFEGELKCVEVDQSGAPLSGNHLKGEATLYTFNNCVIPTGLSVGNCLLTGETCTEACPPIEPEVAKYNALGVLGNENNNGDGILCLGGDVNDNCPNGAEYNACPQTWILNHLAEGAPDPAVADPNASSVTTDITVVPCEENFETQVPTSVTIQFAITNEFEQPFSASTTVRCWKEMSLYSINPVFGIASLGTPFVQTRIRPSGGTANGFMVVADEWHQMTLGPSERSVATAAANLHVEGERPGPDLIVIPAEQLQ